MSWRYQPVIHDDEITVTLCEYYFDADDKLDAWTETPMIAPLGSSLDDLRGDLAHMLADAYKWEPVAFSSLHVGMTFERTGVDVERLIAAMETARKSQ